VETAVLVIGTVAVTPAVTLNDEPVEVDVVVYVSVA
jgi:hypothetical protein